jgi:hypothetical protein
LVIAASIAPSCIDDAAKVEFTFSSIGEQVSSSSGLAPRPFLRAPCKLREILVELI